MDQKNLFKKYYNKVALEGALRSLVWGLVIGFSVDLLIAAITWFTKFNGLWLAIGLGLGVTIASSVIFYFTMYRPTTHKIAARIDALGLEERMITMQQLENDDSYMAMLQREDAKAKLAAVETAHIALFVRKSSVIAMSVVGALAIVMTTLNGLTEAGIIAPPTQVVEEIIDKETFYTVTYEVDGEMGGYIDGDMEQIVVKGENAETVIAVADEGYTFVCWKLKGNEDPDSEEPERTDMKIKEDLKYVAYFDEIEIGEGEGEGEGEPGEGDPGEGEGDAGEGDAGDQGEPGNGQGEGDSSGEGEGDGEGDGQGQGSGNGNGQGGSDGAQGGHNANNTVNNGQDSHMSHMDSANAEAGDALGSGGYGEGEAGMIGGYLGGIGGAGGEGGN